MKLYEVEGHARRGDGVTLVTPLFITSDSDKALDRGEEFFHTGSYFRVCIWEAQEERKIRFFWYTRPGSGNEQTGLTPCRGKGEGR